ncbi:MAG: hypothetical protein ACXWWX_01875 [Actinomycetota bacterium]
MLGLLLVAVLGVTSMLGFAAGNTVPASKAADLSQAASADAMKPTECAGITLSTKVVGSGTFNGTAAADLMIGSSGVDTMNALGGNDCVMGGGGDDRLNGGPGTDVCVGGPGTDTFAGNCDTQIQ